MRHLIGHLSVCHEVLNARVILGACRYFIAIGVC